MQTGLIRRKRKLVDRKKAHKRDRIRLRATVIYRRFIMLKDEPHMRPTIVEVQHTNPGMRRKISSNNFRG